MKFFDSSITIKCSCSLLWMKQKSFYLATAQYETYQQRMCKSGSKPAQKGNCSIMRHCVPY